MKKLSIILLSALLLNSLHANENLKLLAAAALGAVGTHLIVKGIEKNFPMTPLSHKCATLAFFSGSCVTNLSLYSAGINFAFGNNNASQWPFLVHFAAGAAAISSAAISSYKYYHSRPFERLNLIPLNLVLQAHEPVGFALALQEGIRTLDGRANRLESTRHLQVQISVRLDDEVHESYEPGAFAASGVSAHGERAADEAFVTREDTRRSALAGADKASSASALL